MNLGLQDKVVFVAGSSRGIGKGIATVFLEEAARAVITGRDAAAVVSACSELSPGRADRVMTFTGDLGQPAVAQEAHRQVVERWGAVDAVICNIGSGRAKSGWHLSAADWEGVFRTNLWTSVGLVEIFLPQMVEARRGSITFISSMPASRAWELLFPMAPPRPHSNNSAKISRAAWESTASAWTRSHPGTFCFPMEPGSAS